MLSLQVAIHKMTGLSAARLGLKDRGLIKEGYIADLTIFDPEKIIDKSTFTDPHQYPQGIHFVLIGGKLAVENGVFLKAHFGKVIRKTR